MFDYDWNDYKKYIEFIMNNAMYDPDELEIGQDISDIPGVKVAFDGYGDLEEEVDGEYVYTEGGNKNMESYAIFIHKDALVEGFEFPQHDVYSFTFGSMIQHRPAEEVCIYAWHDVVDDSWEIIPLEDRIDSDNKMTVEETMHILKTIYERYGEE